MRIFGKTLVAAALFSVAMQGAFAADDLNKIKAAGEIKFGTEGTYAPFSYHDIAGGLTGFDVEIGRAVAQQMGLKATFVEGKWDGLVAGLDDKRYDAVLNEVSITPARQAKYAFSDPYITSRAVLIVAANNNTIKTFADLKGKKAAETLSSNFGKIAKDSGADIVADNGFNESVDLLLSGRVDATVNDSLSYLDFKKHKPDAKVKQVAVYDAAQNDHSAILLRQGSPELVAAINHALATIKANGTYLKISQKYFGKDVSQ